MKAPLIRKIEFDEHIWHPLDHRLLSQRCRQHPSTVRGARLHLRYLRDFGEIPLRSKIYRRLLCRRGWHRTMVWFKTGEEGRSGVSCWYCEWDADSVQGPPIVVRSGQTTPGESG